MAGKKKEKVTKRNPIQQMHVEQNRKAGAHKDKSKYSRKTKHKNSQE
jgi:hypothetical protein